MDLKKIKRRLGTEKILNDLCRTDFSIFESVSFVFSLSFASILIFRCKVLKSLLSKFCYWTL